MVKAKKVKGVDCKESVVINARKIVDVRLRELLSFGEYVGDPQKIDEIHNLRIAAKRLRYTLEMFRFAFPKELADLIGEVKKVQEHIGDMRDADVMIERVNEILARENAARAERLQQIATATSRGTVSQRHLRIRSAASAPKAARDEVALYTLIAHRAGERDEAYRQFVTAWERFEATDFAGRLRRMVGQESTQEITELQPLPSEAAVAGPEEEGPG
ncbi:hypothetical protein BH24CHL1_BH24CHL1_18490 [soil metagenome]